MRLLQADSAMTAAPLTTTSDLTLIAHIREPAGSSNMELAGKKQEGVGAAGGREGVDMDKYLIVVKEGHQSIVIVNSLKKISL